MNQRLQDLLELLTLARTQGSCVTFSVRNRRTGHSKRLQFSGWETRRHLASGVECAVEEEKAREMLRREGIKLGKSKLHYCANEECPGFSWSPAARPHPSSVCGDQCAEVAA